MSPIDDIDDERPYIERWRGDFSSLVNIYIYRTSPLSGDGGGGDDWRQTDGMDKCVLFVFYVPNWIVRKSDMYKLDMYKSN